MPGHRVADGFADDQPEPGTADQYLARRILRTIYIGDEVPTVRSHT